MYNTLSMEEQVNNVCRNCYISMQQMSEIRPYLTQDATATLVKSLITSKPNCYNALLVGVPDDLLKKLQLVQNNAARLVARSKPSHISPVLKKQHWLPVSVRIECKILLSCFKMFAQSRTILSILYDGSICSQPRSTLC